MLYSLQFKTGVHLLKVELTQLLTLSTYLKKVSIDFFERVKSQLIFLNCHFHLESVAGQGSAVHDFAESFNWGKMNLILIDLLISQTAVLYF